MDDLEEARRLMALVSSRATQAGPIEANTIINMAKVWAHIALVEATREQTAEVKRVADALSANK